MKKIIGLILVITSFILVGCQPKSETLGITEIDELSAELEEVINPNLKLQIAYDGDTQYIVLHTTGNAEATVTAEEEIASVNFDINKVQSGQINQYIYILTLDPEQDTIDVSINGESTYFDSSIAF